MGGVDAEKFPSTDCAQSDYVDDVLMQHHPPANRKTLQNVLSLVVNEKPRPGHASLWQGKTPRKLRPPRKSPPRKRR